MTKMMIEFIMYLRSTNNFTDILHCKMLVEIFHHRITILCSIIVVVGSVNSLCGVVHVCWYIRTCTFVDLHHLSKHTTTSSAHKVCTFLPLYTLLHSFCLVANNNHDNIRAGDDTFINFTNNGGIIFPPVFFTVHDKGGLNHDSKLE